MHERWFHATQAAWIFSCPLTLKITAAAFAPSWTRMWCRWKPTRPHTTNTKTSAKSRSSPSFEPARGPRSCGRCRCHALAVERSWAQWAWQPVTKKPLARRSARSFFNCAAPDDGNMMVLQGAAQPSSRARWLQPIIDGHVRSSFAMTEPHGARLRPFADATTRDEDGRPLGHPRAASGSSPAAKARSTSSSSPAPRRTTATGLTAFLFDRDQPGWRIVRRIPIMGPEEHGGHCELEFDGLEIPDEHRLLEVGDGLRVTQIRLGTARLTHCMRWLGLAKRAWRSPPPTSTSA